MYIPGSKSYGMKIVDRKCLPAPPSSFVERCRSCEMNETVFKTITCGFPITGVNSLLQISWSDLHRRFLATVQSLTTHDHIEGVVTHQDITYFAFFVFCGSKYINHKRVNGQFYNAANISARPTQENEHGSKFFDSLLYLT